MLDSISSQSYVGNTEDVMCKKPPTQKKTESISVPPQTSKPLFLECATHMGDKKSFHERKINTPSCYEPVKYSLEGLCFNEKFDFFISRLTHQNILNGVVLLSLPITLPDGRYFSEIKSFRFFSFEEAEASLNTLDKYTLGLYIIVGKENDFIYLSMHKNDGAEKNKLKIDERSGMCLQHCDFFTMCFDLSYNYMGELYKIPPKRYVNDRFRKHGICTKISLNFLSELYATLGHEGLYFDSSAAVKIATAKFSFPLNAYKLSNETALRDIDPTTLKTSDIEKIMYKGENLEADFSQFNPGSDYGRSPLERVFLKNLLAQYLLKNDLISR